MMPPTEPQVALGVIGQRLLRLARLDTSVFAEVRYDATATVPAILVLTASTFLAGLGGWLWWLIKDFGDGGKVFVQSVILGTFVSVALWMVWMLLAWVILTQLFREDADWQEMLRTMGLASAPLAISALMFLPGVDVGIALASVALLFGLTTIAIQATTTADSARVLVANLGGFAVWAIVLGLVVTKDTYLAPGVFLLDSPIEKAADVAKFLTIALL